MIPERMRYVNVRSAGGPDVMDITEGDVPRAQKGEILIEVFAAGVNRPDLSQRAGKYPPPPGASPVLGLEVAGLVKVADDGSRFLAGQRVCALTSGGGYAGYCAVPESQCLPVPENFSWEEAAGIPETFFTVWANVFQLGGLRAGERFLVHGGSSGIGTTAIQLARAFGAEVFATAGSDKKCQASRDLGAHHALNYKQVIFEEEIARLTGGAGVNVVLDMVGGDYTARNLAALAMDGRIVQIAVQRGAEASLNLVKIMQKRAILTGSMLRPRSVAEKARIAAALEENVWPFLETNSVRVVVDRVFPFAQVRAAHEYLETGENIGKVILSLR